MENGRSEIEGIDFGGRDVVDSRGSKEAKRRRREGPRSKVQVQVRCLGGCG
jgi:hypothetical protein